MNAPSTSGGGQKARKGNARRRSPQKSVTGPMLPLDCSIGRVLCYSRSKRCNGAAPNSVACGGRIFRPGLRGQRAHQQRTASREAVMTEDLKKIHSYLPTLV